MGAKTFRLSIGADILEKMEENKEFPISNIRELTKIMMSYFKNKSYGYKKELTKNNYKWKPDVDYWKNHLKDIRELLRKERKRYFEFLRINRKFEGYWMFVDKEGFFNSLKWGYSDIGTRTESYNDKLDDGNEKWDLKLPHIEDVPLLE
jgi:hypothetical protein